jgi:hypothetical protein
MLSAASDFSFQVLVNLALFLIALGVLCVASRVLSSLLCAGFARDVVAFPSQLASFMVRAARDPAVLARSWLCLGGGILFVVLPSDALALRAPLPEAIDVLVAVLALHFAVCTIPLSTRRAACPTGSALFGRYLRIAE